MSTLGRVTGRLDPRWLSAGLNPRRPIARSRTPPAPAALPPGGGQALTPGGLTARHDELQRELAGLQFDLGGLAYEMAIRDHFRLDVLVRQAALLQEVDAQLGTAEHLHALEQNSAPRAYSVPQLGQAPAAPFRSSCGTHLVRTDVVPG